MTTGFDTSFGSQTVMTRQRSCIVCGIDFEREDRVKYLHPDKGLYFAHIEHFEPPVPEPPGTPRWSFSCGTCNRYYDGGQQLIDHIKEYHEDHLEDE